jgi:hypothetical protein
VPLPEAEGPSMVMTGLSVGMAKTLNQNRQL